MIVVAIAAGLIGYVIGKPAPPQAQAKAPDASEKPAEPQEPAFMKEGLVAYYPFNGNAKDESGNGNDGESRGAVLAKDRHGNADSSYEFMPRSSIVLRDNRLLDGVENATITSWVFLKPNSPRRGPIVFSGDGRLGNDPISFNLFVDMKQIVAGNSDAFVAIPETSASLNKLLTPRKWTHYAIVLRSGSELSVATLYLDGEKIASINAGNSFKCISYDRPMPAHIGNTQDGNWVWGGRLDDIRIYNRALSEEQVKALYEFEKPKE